MKFAVFLLLCVPAARAIFITALPTAFSVPDGQPSDIARWYFFYPQNIDECNDWKLQAGFEDHDLGFSSTANDAVVAGDPGPPYHSGEMRFSDWRFPTGSAITYDALLNDARYLIRGITFSVTIRYTGNVDGHTAQLAARPPSTGQEALYSTSNSYVLTDAADRALNGGFDVHVYGDSSDTWSATRADLTTAFGASALELVVAAQFGSSQGAAKIGCVNMNIEYDDLGPESTSQTPSTTTAAAASTSTVTSSTPMATTSTSDVSTAGTGSTSVITAVQTTAQKTTAMALTTSSTTGTTNAGITAVTKTSSTTSATTVSNSGDTVSSGGDTSTPHSSTTGTSTIPDDDGRSDDDDSGGQDMQMSIPGVMSSSTLTVSSQDTADGAVIVILVVILVIISTAFVAVLVLWLRQRIFGLNSRETDIEMLKHAIAARDAQLNGPRNASVSVAAPGVHSANKSSATTDMQLAVVHVAHNGNTYQSASNLQRRSTADDYGTLELKRKPRAMGDNGGNSVYTAPPASIAAYDETTLTPQYQSTPKPHTDGVRSTAAARYDRLSDAQTPSADYDTVDTALVNGGTTAPDLHADGTLPSDLIPLSRSRRASHSSRRGAHSRLRKASISRAVDPTFPSSPAAAVPTTFNCEYESVDSHFHGYTKKPNNGDT